jgi:hypothetical protein
MQSGGNMGIKISNYSFVRSVGYSARLAGFMFLAAVALYFFQVQPNKTLAVLWVIFLCACVVYSLLGSLYVAWVLQCNACGAKAGAVIASSFENGLKYRRKVIHEGRCPSCDSKITGLMFDGWSKKRDG